MFKYQCISLHSFLRVYRCDGVFMNWIRLYVTAMPVSSELWLHGVRRRSWARFLLEPGGASRSPESPRSFQPISSRATFPANNVNSPSRTHVSAGSAGAWLCHGAGGKCVQSCHSSGKAPPGQLDSRVWAGRAADPQVAVTAGACTCGTLPGSRPLGCPRRSGGMCEPVG